MTYKLAFFVALLPSPLLAQTAQAVNYQQPSWIGAPGSDTVTVHITRLPGQTGPILQDPFSAEEVRHTQQTLADGTHLDHNDVSHFYRDAKGRMRDDGGSHSVIFDPVGGHTYELNPDAKTYYQHPADSAQTTTVAATNNHISTDSPGVPQPVQTAERGHLPWQSEPVDHVDTQNLGTQEINGVLCQGTRTIVTIPAGALGNDHAIKIVDERWYSDDLQALVKSINTDPRFGVTTYELTEIIRSEPDAALFQVPAGYTLKERR